MIKIIRMTETPGRHDYFYHRHTDLEINMFETGKGSYLIAGKECSFEGGDIFLFANNEVHMVNYVDPSEPMHTLKMFFTPRFLWDNSIGIFNQSFLRIFFERNKNSGVMLTHDLPVAQKLRELMLKIEEENNNQHYEYENIIKFHLINILILIVRHFRYYHTDKDDIALHMTNYDSIKDVLTYIDENFSEDIRLDDLTTISNMSKNSLIQVFKKLNGVSPYNYIILKRVNQAIRLLTQTDSSVLDIIHDCGFSNPVSFYKLMKKYSGKTPMEIRAARDDEGGAKN